MKLPIMLLGMLFPITAMALDTSNCEQIGHVAANLTIENVCWQETERCAPSEWTADDCAAQRTECDTRVTEHNAAMEKNCILMRCPVTDELRAYKNGDKTMGFQDGHMVYSDGTSVVINDLVSDEENVYLYYRCAEEILPGAPSWYAFGPNSEGKFNMHHIQE